MATFVFFSPEARTGDGERVGLDFGLDLSGFIKFTVIFTIRLIITSPVNPFQVTARREKRCLTCTPLSHVQPRAGAKVYRQHPYVFRIT